MKLVCVFLLGVSLCSCSSSDTAVEITHTEGHDDLFRKSLNEYDPFVQLIIGKEERDFRGVALGMKMSEVRAVEKAHHEETDSLTVRYDFENGIENNAEIEYIFNADSILLDMNLTVFCAQESKRDSIYTDLKNYFSYRQKIASTDSLFWWKADSAKVIVSKDGIPRFPGILIRCQKQPSL